MLPQGTTSGMFKIQFLSKQQSMGWEGDELTWICNSTDQRKQALCWWRGSWDADMFDVVATLAGVDEVTLGRRRSRRLLPGAPLPRTRSQIRLERSLQASVGSSGEVSSCRGVVRGGGGTVGVSCGRRRGWEWTPPSKEKPSPLAASSPSGSTRDAPDR
jgi:hypothetical protein